MDGPHHQGVNQVGQNQQIDLRLGIALHDKRARLALVVVPIELEGSKETGAVVRRPRNLGIIA